MLVLTDAMHREERLEKMWRTLDLLRPEGNVLLIEEQEGICWVVPKEEVEPDNRTDRSTYGQDYANDAAAVKYLARAEMIVPLLDPGGRDRPCFQLGERGRRALEEKQYSSSGQRLWIIIYERGLNHDAYPYVGVEEPDPKLVVAAHRLGSLDESANFRMIGPLDLAALRINSILMKTSGPLSQLAKNCSTGKH